MCGRKAENKDHWRSLQFCSARPRVRECNLQHFVDYDRRQYRSMRLHNTSYTAFSDSDENRGVEVTLTSAPPHVSSSAYSTPKISGGKDEFGSLSGQEASKSCIVEVRNDSGLITSVGDSDTLTTDSPTMSRSSSTSSSSLEENHSDSLATSQNGINVSNAKGSPNIDLDTSRNAVFVPPSRHANVEHDKVTDADAAAGAKRCHKASGASSTTLSYRSHIHDEMTQDLESGASGYVARTEKRSPGSQKKSISQLTKPSGSPSDAVTPHSQPSQESEQQFNLRFISSSPSGGSSSKTTLTPSRVGGLSFDVATPSRRGSPFQPIDTPSLSPSVQGAIAAEVSCSTPPHAEGATLRAEHEVYKETISMTPTSPQHSPGKKHGSSFRKSPDNPVSSVTSSSSNGSQISKFLRKSQTVVTGVSTNVRDSMWSSPIREGGTLSPRPPRSPRVVRADTMPSLPNFFSRGNGSGRERGSPDMEEDANSPLKSEVEDTRSKLPIFSGIGDSSMVPTQEETRRREDSKARQGLTRRGKDGPKSTSTGPGGSNSAFGLRIRPRSASAGRTRAAYKNPYHLSPSTGEATGDPSKDSSSVVSGTSGSGSSKGISSSTKEMFVRWLSRGGTHHSAQSQTDSSSGGDSFTRGNTSTSGTLNSGRNAGLKIEKKPSSENASLTVNSPKGHARSSSDSSLGFPTLHRHSISNGGVGAGKTVPSPTVGSLAVSSAWKEQIAPNRSSSKKKDTRYFVSGSGIITRVTDSQLKNPKSFTRSRILAFWENSEVKILLSPICRALLKSASKSYIRGQYDDAARNFSQAIETILLEQKGRVLFLGSQRSCSDDDDLDDEDEGEHIGVGNTNSASNSVHGKNSLISRVTVGWRGDAADNKLSTVLNALIAILIQQGNSHFHMDDYDAALKDYYDAFALLDQLHKRTIGEPESMKSKQPEGEEHRREVNDGFDDEWPGDVSPTSTAEKKLSLAPLTEDSIQGVLEEEDNTSASLQSLESSAGSAFHSVAHHLTSDHTRDTRDKLSGASHQTKIDYLSPTKEANRFSLGPDSPESPPHLSAMAPENHEMRGRILNNIASVHLKTFAEQAAHDEYALSLKMKRYALRAMRDYKENGTNVMSKNSSIGINSSDTRDDNSDHERRCYLRISKTLHNIGLLRQSQDKLTKAVDTYKKALALRVENRGLNDISVASTLNNLGNVYYAQGNYNLALRSYNEVLRILKIHLGPRHLKVASTLHNIGLVCKTQGPYGRAKAALVEAAQIRRKKLGDAHADVASTLHLLGVVLTNMGELDNAMKSLLSALRIRKRVHGDSSGHMQILNTRLAIGMVHCKRGKLEEAMAAFRIVCEERMRRLGVSHESVSEALQCIGLLYKERMEDQKAIDIFQEVLRVRRCRLGDESLALAETLNVLSSSYFKVGQKAKALDYCRESLRITKLKVGTDHIAYATPLKNLADFHQDRGEYDSALVSYEEVLRIRKSWQDRSLDVGDTWNNIGNTHFKRAEFAKAKDAFVEALKIKQIWLENGNLSVITTLNNLGHANYKIRDLDGALEAYRRSLQYQIRRLCAQHYDDDELAEMVNDVRNRLDAMNAQHDEVKRISDALGNIASTLRNVGLVYQDKGEFDKALRVYNTSLSVRKIQTYPDHASLAATAETIGMLQFKAGNHEGAMASFCEALEVKVASQGSDTVDVARTLNNMANLYFSKGNLDEAKKMYQRALEIKRSRLGGFSEEVANTLNNIAHVLFTSGEMTDSLEAYNEVLEIRKRNHGDNHLSVAVTLANIGDVHLKQNSLHMARICYEQSVRIRRLRHSKHYADDARVIENLAGVYAKLADWKKAEMACSECLRLKNRILSLDKENAAKQDDVATTLELLAFVYKQCGQRELALKVYSELEELRSKNDDSFEETPGIDGRHEF